MLKIINLVYTYTRTPLLQENEKKKSKIGAFAVRMLNGIYENTNIFGNKHAVH